MVEPKVLAQGIFTPEDLEVSFSEESNLVLTPAIQKEVDETWEKLLKDAKENSKRVWNGISCRVNALDHVGDSLKVEFAPIDFKTREGLLGALERLELPEESYRRGAFVGGLVRTSDNYYVFVYLSGRSVNTNKVDMVGGIVGDESVVRTGADLFSVMYQELEEETATPKASVESCVLQLAFLSPATNIGFHFAIELSDTREQLERRFAEKAVDPDIESLLFVSPRELSFQLIRMGGYKPFLNKMLFAQKVV